VTVFVAVLVAVEVTVWVAVLVAVLVTELIIVLVDVFIGVEVRVGVRVGVAGITALIGTATLRLQPAIKETDNNVITIKEPIRFFIFTFPLNLLGMP